MIIKSYEIKDKEISKFGFFLVYGENEGLKKEIINKIKNKHNNKEVKYEEAQILRRMQGQHSCEFSCQISPASQNFKVLKF